MSPHRSFPLGYVTVFYFGDPDFARPDSMGCGASLNDAAGNSATVNPAHEPSKQHAHEIAELNDKIAELEAQMQGSCCSYISVMLTALPPWLVHCHWPRCPISATAGLCYPCIYACLYLRHCLPLWSFLSCSAGASSHHSPDGGSWFGGGLGLARCEIHEHPQGMIAAKVDLIVTAFNATDTFASGLIQVRCASCLAL